MKNSNLNSVLDVCDVICCVYFHYEVFCINLMVVWKSRLCSSVLIMNNIKILEDVDSNQ